MEPVRYRHRVLELKVSFLESPWRYGANIANDPSRDTDDDCMIGHIAGDNRAGTDQGVFANADARKDRRIAAD